MTSPISGPVDPWLEIDQIAMLMCRRHEYVRLLFASGQIVGTKRRGRWVARRSTLVAFLSENLRLIGQYKPPDAPYDAQERVSAASAPKLE